MKIEIEKISETTYLIRLDGAMVSFVEKEELLKICEEIKYDKESSSA